MTLTIRHLSDSEILNVQSVIRFDQIDTFYSYHEGRKLLLWFENGSNEEISSNKMTLVLCWSSLGRLWLVDFIWVEISMHSVCGSGVMTHKFWGSN